MVLVQSVGGIFCVSFIIRSIVRNISIYKLSEVDQFIQITCKQIIVFTLCLRLIRMHGSLDIGDSHQQAELLLTRDTLVHSRSQSKARSNYFLSLPIFQMLWIFSVRMRRDTKGLTTPELPSNLLFHETSGDLHKIDYILNSALVLVSVLDLVHPLLNSFSITRWSWYQMKEDICRDCFSYQLSVFGFGIRG